MPSRPWLLLGLVALACGSGTRPQPEAWWEVWTSERAGRIDAAALEGPDAEDACRRLLVWTREVRPRLLPAPDQDLDGAVDAWLQRAGALALNCPGAEGDVEAVRAALRDLDELAAEVRAGLHLERAAPPPGAASPPS